ncbi:MAG: NAD(P)H-hydrate dehydratase [Acidimicrobiales bacterium]
MTEIDAAAADRIDDLIDRAGRAVARSAIRMLGGSYGRRVVVLAGPGNNGADGRVAAHHLERRGVRVTVVDALTAPSALPAADLVVDAAFGNGLSRDYVAPAVAPFTPVLAVDIPSGVDGLTGRCLGAPLRADRTVTFQALAPGLVLEPGRDLAGSVEVVDIGLALGDVSVHVVEPSDVGALLTRRPVDDHKWRSGVRVVGGSPGMTGAAWLAARSAQRCGAGIVQLSMPGARGDEGPIESVAVPLPLDGWADAAFATIEERVCAVLVGPGLGPVGGVELMAACGLDQPVVFDGDALRPELVTMLADRAAATVLTPHDGEWRRLGGSDDADRIGATRAFAQAHQVTVVRKGPTTIVAAPDGSARVIVSGTAALATAGTGDVLAGAIVALLARGHSGPDAATIAAHVHGVAGARLGPGLVASEVADLLPAVIADLGAHG